MSYTPKVFVPQQYVENTATKKYTAPATVDGGKGAWIDKAAFSNSSGASATLTVYIVPAGGAAGGSTNAIPSFSVGPGDEISLAGLAGRFIAPGTEIWWASNTASAITGAINGREVT